MRVKRELVAMEIPCEHWDCQHGTLVTSGVPCADCNGTGSVPMFPMLREACNLCEGRGRIVDFRLNVNPRCTKCGAKGWWPILTDAPMNQLLGRIRNLGYLYIIAIDKVLIARKDTAWEIIGRSTEEGTDYERLIFALHEALKAKASSGN